MKNAVVLQHRGGFPARLWQAGRTSGVLIPLAFVVLTVLFAPLTDAREFDFDEGVNLIKGLLANRGYGLYTEIWSDQPPLLTVVLAQTIHWFGLSVTAARAVVLLFSALLIWAFYQTVRRSVSEPAALLAVVALAFSAYYVRLSISVMIGLPALALAMLSVYLFVLAQDRRAGGWTILSGIVLALSMQTKLFTVIVLPVMLAHTILAGQPGIPARLDLMRRLRAAALWLSAVILSFFVLALAFHSLAFDQLIGPHLAGQARAAFVNPENLALITGTVARHPAQLLLALAGIAWAGRRREPGALLPLGWSVLAIAFLLFETPIKYHHVLLLTIPLAWLGAFGAEAGIRAFGRLTQSRRGAARPAQVILVSASLALIALVIYQPDTLKPRLITETFGGIAYNEQVVSLLCPDSHATGEWVFSDRPFYAFLAGKSVPPPIAVVTGKRFISGAITEDALLDALQTYHPRYVVLERFLPNLSPAFLAELEKSYQVAIAYRWGPDELPGQFLVGRWPVGDGKPGSAPVRAEAAFDNWLSLSWVRESLQGNVQAGDCLDVRDLRWARPETQPGRDLAVSLRLVDEAGEIWVQHDEQVGSDWNTLLDQPAVTDFLNPFIPEGTPPGPYHLWLVLYDPLTGKPLPVTSATAPPSDALELGQLQIERPATPPTARRALADFGNVQLIQASTAATEIEPGDIIPVSLLWQAAPDFQAEPLVVVAQLIDQSGAVVASLEEQPVAGRYPAQAWQSNELVRDVHRLVTPADMAAGEYGLIVGVYRAADGTRLQASTGLLDFTSRDHFRVGMIAVH